MKRGSNKDDEAARREDAENYYAEIRDDRNYASRNVSTQIRSTVLAVLALTWLLLNGAEPVLAKKFGCFSGSLMWLGVVCVSALLADFLQGICALRETDKAANDSADALSEKRYDDVGYDEGSRIRVISTFLYYAKACLVVVSAIWLVIVIARALSGACLCVAAS
jgi:hypothetical protein